MYEFRRGGGVSESESLIATLQGSGKHTYWPAEHRRARARLLAFRESIADSPVWAVAAFALLSLVWTGAYTLTLIAYGDPNLVVHLSPHVAYLPLFWSVVLFPRSMLWFPILLFSALYGLTVAAAFVVGGPISPEQKALYSFAYVGNLFVAGYFGIATDRLISGKGRLNALGIGLERMLLGFAFVSSVIGAALIFAFVEFFIQTRAIMESGAVQGNLAEHSLYVLFRGIRGGVIAVFIAILCIFRTRFRDIYSVAAAFPFFAAVLVFRDDVFTHHIEVAFSVFLLGFAILVRPVPVALLGLVGAFAFAMSSGTFVLTPDQPGGAALFSEGWSSVLLVLVVLLLIRNVHDLKQANAVRDAVRGIGVIRKIASVGRFNLDAESGSINFDEMASRITGLPASTSLRYFRRSVLPGGADQLDRILNVAGGDMREARFQVAVEGQGEVRNLLLFAFPDEFGDESGTAIRGYVVGVDDDGGILPYNFQDLSETARHKGPSGVEQLLPTLTDELSHAVAEVCAAAPGDDPHLTQARRNLLNEVAKFRVLSPGHATAGFSDMMANPKDVFDRVVAEFTIACPDCNFNPTVLPVPPLDQPEMLDVDRVSNILVKLVLSAARHSGGTGVWLSHFRETNEDNQTWSVWTVEDDGKGLEETGAFVAGAEGNKRFFGSGMRAVRVAVEAMGGSLRSFPGIRGGARIEVRFPFRAAASDHMDQTPAAQVRPEHWIVAGTEADEGKSLTSALASIVNRVSYLADLSEVQDLPNEDSPDAVLFDLSRHDAGTLRGKLMSIKARWHHVRLIGISSEPMARVPSGLVEQILQRPIVERQLRAALDGRMDGRRTFGLRHE